MAKRTGRQPARTGKNRAKPSKKRAAARATKRPKKARAVARKARPVRKKARPARRKTRPARRLPARNAKAAARKAPRKTRSSQIAAKAPGLDRARRTLYDEATIQTPPSSLDMDRRGSAARSGRAEMLDERMKQGAMTSVTAGDLDVNAEDAYFTGDEAPGGDNSTPDQDIVDDIGKAVGVQYQDDEELRASDKVAARDKHRWELDPASSEDYKGRK